MHTLSVSSHIGTGLRLCACASILAFFLVAVSTIQAQTRAVPPHAVDVIFTVEKPRASLLRAPWRLAPLSWLRRGRA